MKSFFEGIAYLFEEILFLPFEALRALELESWTLANSINWIFMLICAAAITYWVMQLKKITYSYASAILIKLVFVFYVCDVYFFLEFSDLLLLLAIFFQYIINENECRFLVHYFFFVTIK